MQHHKWDKVLALGLAGLLAGAGPGWAQTRAQQQQRQQQQRQQQQQQENQRQMRQQQEMLRQQESVLNKQQRELDKLQMQQASTQWQQKMFDDLDKTVDLAPEQKDKVKAMIANAAKQLEALGPVNSAAKRDQAKKINATMRQQVTASLTPEQQDRLSGKKAPTTAEQFEKEIGLTAEQKAKIKPILAAADKQSRAIAADAKLTPQQQEDKLNDLHDATQAQLDQIYTPDQQEKIDRFWLAQKMVELTELLDLTDKQKPKIKPILEVSLKEARAVRNDRTLSPNEKHLKMLEVRETAHSRIAELLSPTQEIKFDQPRIPVAKPKTDATGRAGQRDTQGVEKP